MKNIICNLIAILIVIYLLFTVIKISIRYDNNRNNEWIKRGYNIEDIYSYMSYSGLGMETLENSPAARKQLDKWISGEDVGKPNKEMGGPV